MTLDDLIDEEEFVIAEVGDLIYFEKDCFEEEGQGIVLGSVIERDTSSGRICVQFEPLWLDEVAAYYGVWSTGANHSNDRGDLVTSDQGG